MSKKDPGCFYTLSHPFICFRRLYMVSYAFIRFDILSNNVIYSFLHFSTLFYAFLCFYTLSYAFHTLFIRFSYTFICFSYAFILFHMLFICFHMHSNASTCFSIPQVTKQTNVFLPTTTTPSHTNLRLSRCAAGKNIWP